MPKRILLIDDTPEIAQLLTYSLRDHGHEVFGHLRNNFEGITFAMRTLEAWGAMIENDTRAYYTAGGRVWVLDLEPCAAKKPRLPGTSKG